MTKLAASFANWENFCFGLKGRILIRKLTSYCLTDSGGSETPRFLVSLAWVSVYLFTFYSKRKGQI
jgi:hypothetical protein